MARDDLRAVIGDLVRGVRPLDAREAGDQAGIAEWVASGQQLFRTVPPATPPKHLVVYFVPLDETNRCLLLVDHVKAGLWLPPGGHVDDREDPRRSVEREACEELGIRPDFHGRLGAGRPFFLTATRTRGEPSHTDVTLWYILAGDRAAELRPDPREFRAIRWFGLDERTGWPADRFDPQMHRFVRKLKSAIGGVPHA